MISDRQIRERIARLRRELRERKRGKLGLPAKKKGPYMRDGHEYLDWNDALAITQRRIEVFEAAGGEVTWWDKTDPSTVEETRQANCQLCAETHLVGWLEGEWDHQCELKKHCDSVKCSAFGCEIGHKGRHGRFLRWTPRAAHREQQVTSRQKEAG